MTNSLAILADRGVVPLQGIVDKRLEVERLIDSYATGAAVLNVGINLAGFIPVPGAGVAAMAAAIVAQAPAVYQPMSKEIAEIYHRSPGRDTARIVGGGAIDAGLQLAIVDIGIAFLQEIAIDIIQDIGFGAILAAIPFFGGFVASALDARIGYQMAWRVGYTVALYHENAGEWVGGSRAATYRYVKRAFADAKRQGRSKPGIPDLANSQTPIGQQQQRTIHAMAAMLIDAGLTKADVRERLLAKGFEARVIDDAIAAS